MSTLETKVNLLASAIGADIKALRLADGDLTALSTTAKTSLVAAINELFGMSGVQINDTASDGVTTQVWSANKVFDSITEAVSALRNELTAGASGALDTFAELAAAINNDASFSAAIATSLANRVRYDAPQTLSVLEQQQACSNIGIGDPFADFLSVYVAAKA